MGGMIFIVCARRARAEVLEMPRPLRGSAGMSVKAHAGLTSRSAGQFQATPAILGALFLTTKSAHQHNQFESDLGPTYMHTGAPLSIDQNT